MFTQEGSAGQDTVADKQEVNFKQETSAAILKSSHSELNIKKDAWKSGTKQLNNAQLSTRGQDGYIDGLENIMNPNRDHLSFYRYHVVIICLLSIFR